MSLNLGLEALYESDYSSDSMEDLMTGIADTLSSVMEAQSAMNRLNNIMYTVENINAVAEVVSTYGYTQSIEALVGENFPNGYSQENIGQWFKEAGKKIWNWILSVVAKIKAFFAKFFATSKDMVAALKKRRTEIPSKPIDEIHIKIASADKITGLANDVTNVLGKVISKDMTDVIELVNKAASEGSANFNIRDHFAKFAAAGDKIKAIKDKFNNIEEGEDIKDGDGAKKLIDAVIDLLENTASVKSVFEKFETGVKSLKFSDLTAAPAPAKAEDKKDDKKEDNNNYVIDSMKSLKSFMDDMEKTLSNFIRVGLKYGSLCLSAFKPEKFHDVVAKEEKKEEKKEEAPKTEGSSQSLFWF